MVYIIVQLRKATGKIVKKFEEADVITNIERPVHRRFARSAEIIAIVSETFAEDPNVSIPRSSQEFGLFYSTLWRILHLDLHQHPYKVQLTQQLKSADHSQRRRYVQWSEIFRTEFSSGIKHILHSVGMLRILTILK